MIGIIGAMTPEVLDLVDNISDCKKETISGINFYSGTIGKNEVVVAKSGIGKTFAAMCSEIMILKYHVDEVVHIGIAGALSEKLGIKDVAIASSVVQHDLNSIPFDPKYGMIEDLNMVEIPCDKEIVNKIAKCAENLNVKYLIGVIASGDQFIDNENEKERIKKNFNAIAAEMEGASTGLVCYVNKVKFCVLRAMSDKSDENAEDDYYSQKKIASDVSTRIILSYLKM